MGGMAEGNERKLLIGERISMVNNSIPCSVFLCLILSSSAFLASDPMWLLLITPTRAHSQVGEPGSDGWDSIDSREKGGRGATNACYPLSQPYSSCASILNVITDFVNIYGLDLCVFILVYRQYLAKKMSCIVVLLHFLLLKLITMAITTNSLDINYFCHNTFVHISIENLQATVRLSLLL